MKINRIVKAVSLAIVVFWNGSISNGQVILFQNLEVDTITEISGQNEHLVNTRVWPYPIEERNGLAPKITSTKLFYSNQDAESIRIKEISEKIENDYISKHSITDNNEIKERYAIIRIGNQYLLKKRNTIKRYLYAEGAGVKSYISINEEPGYQENKVLLIFDNNVSYSENQFIIDSILPESESDFIPSFKKISYQDSQNNYEFLYTSSFCKGDFQFNGFGTVFPTFYNLELKVTDLKTGKSCLLFQNPHDNDLKVKSIELGDINKDNKKDIIITIETMICLERVLYLTSDNSDNEPFKYIGRMIIFCDYP